MNGSAANCDARQLGADRRTAAGMFELHNRRADTAEVDETLLLPTKIATVCAATSEPLRKIVDRRLYPPL